MPATHVTASSSTVTKQKARKELAALVREFDEQKSRGALAVAFEAKLSKWRVEIARSILRYGKLRDAEIISGPRSAYSIESSFFDCARNLALKSTARSTTWPTTKMDSGPCSWRRTRSAIEPSTMACFFQVVSRTILPGLKSTFGTGGSRAACSNR